MEGIIMDFIPEGRRNRPGYKLEGPRYVTIHSTGNTSAGAGAQAHGNYLKGGAASVPASWHFTVDDKEIRQHLPLDEVAWHAGDGARGTGNRSSLAVEICENSDGDLERAILNAARLTAFLLEQFGLGIDRVKQHFDWSGKSCPRIFRSRPGSWEDFLRKVEGYRGQGGSGEKQQGVSASVSSWAEEAQKFVMEKGFSDGTRPRDPTTREELWTIVHRVYEDLKGP